MAYNPIIDFYDEPGGPNGGYKGGGSGGGGGGTKRVELFNETVTTVDSDGMNRGLVLGNGTTADKVYVTFDGTEYELPKVQFPGGSDYGYGAFGETGPDFSTYPLMLSYSEEAEGWYVFTETAGTYTIVAYTVSSGGGGGMSLGELMFVGVMGADEVSIFVSTTPFDITSGETISDISSSAYNSANVCRANGSSVDAPIGCYAVVQASVPADWTTDSLVVTDANGEQQITSGFECRVVSGTYLASAFFTMQIPANGLSLEFSNEGDIG